MTVHDPALTRSRDLFSPPRGGQLLDDGDRGGGHGLHPHRRRLHLPRLVSRGPGAACPLRERLVRTEVKYVHTYSFP